MIVRVVYRVIVKGVYSCVSSTRLCSCIAVGVCCIHVQAKIAAAATCCSGADAHSIETQLPVSAGCELRTAAAPGKLIYKYMMCDEHTAAQASVRLAWMCCVHPLTDCTWLSVPCHPDVCEAL